MTRRSGPRAGRVGVVLMIVLAAAAAAAPWVAPDDPLAIVGASLEAPSWRHPLGTDRLGRDILSRILYGARLSLGGALAALALITTIGVAVGALAGFAHRLIDGLLMRLVDAVLAIPALILALAIAGLFPPGLLTVILALAAVWWARFARVTRALVLAYRERQFVDAARALGAGRVHILRRHLLPHLLAPILVLAALEFGALILAVASLTFLGLGVQPPAPEWGAMINDAKGVFLIAPHALIAPGLTVAAAVLAFNLVGEYVGDRWGGGPLAESRPGAAPVRVADAT